MEKHLSARIVEEIAAAGPMPFTRFMELALTDPADGYYTGPTVRAGKTGDFITAPELHPLLGSAIARTASEAWQRIGTPTSFTWIEFGAGAGALLCAAVEQWHRDHAPILSALNVMIVEANPYRREELQTRLRALPGGGPQVLPLQPAQAGIVIANEFLDALPFHILVGRPTSKRGFMERCVSVAPNTADLCWVECEPKHSTVDRLREHLAGHPLVEGQLAEVSLATTAWVAALPSLLSSGLVLVLDYGRVGSELRDPATRMAGTALAYQGHRASTNLLAEPGERDLTAHVDLTALRGAAAAAGLTHIAATTQAGYLASAGLDDEVARLRTGPEATLESALAVRGALAHLMDPRRMGGFAIEAFALGSTEQRARLADEGNPLPGMAAPIRRLV